MKYRKIAEEGVVALRDAVVRAMGKVQEYVTSNQARLADIYVGRDPGGTLLIPPQGIPQDVWLDATRAQSWSAPDTGVNLLLSRLLQIYVASTPGRPTFSIVPKNGAAARLAEHQDELTDIWVEGSRMEDAVKRVAWLLPIQNHVGVRLCENYRARDAYEKIKWEVVEAVDCGIEPFSRRFSWHGRVCQWGDLDEGLQKMAAELRPVGQELPNPWDPVALTEVFDSAFALEEGDATRKKPRVHVFVNFAGKFYRDSRSKRPNIGDYVGTYDLRACPLHIISNLQPAPHEDIAPAEAVAWIPTLNMIQNLVVQIERESSATNNMVLYDADRIAPDKMRKAWAENAGRVVLIPVSGASDTRGISHTMRPVERNTILGELITSLQTMLGLLDDVTGVGPQDRGLSINPSKSATEASVLSASSSRRTQGRLRVLTSLWETMAMTVFEYQQDYFGKVVESPGNGIVRKLPVPSPEQARFEFKVALDEMENLSRRGRLDTQMMMHTVLTRDAATFAQGVPKLVRESERRLLKAAGWTDIDNYLDRPVIEGGPEDRYIAALENGRDIPVFEDDDHALYISYYGKLLERAVTTGDDGVPVDALQQALSRHQVYLRQRDAAAINQASNPAPVPGMSGQGEVDNAMRQQLAAGLPPQMTPQMLQ